MAYVKELDITVLDHIDDIRVPGNVFEEPTNEYWALLCMFEGMEFLCRQVQRAENVVASRTPKGVHVVHFGNSGMDADIPKALLTCAFHWYAVSACNYVRTVNIIAQKCDPARDNEAYVKAVLPEVKPFRDKVAAHFAWTTRNKRDNDAERLVSVFPQLTFNSDAYYASDWTVRLTRGEEVTSSAALVPWSLSKVHEGLRKRYWPDLLMPQPDMPSSEEAV